MELALLPSRQEMRALEFNNQKLVSDMAASSKDEECDQAGDGPRMTNRRAKPVLCS